MDVSETAVKPKRKLSGAAAMGPGPGRPKGSQDKVPREVKAMVLQALDKAGGVAYLARCATNPKLAPAFLALVGKVLPLQITGPGGGPVQFQKIERTIVDPSSK